MADAKVLIAMSGGVDSSVAAWLMTQAGFGCIGATMRLCDGLTEPSTAARDALGVARKLGLPFYEFDNTKLFEQHVVQAFVRCYEQGGTPNPCLYCNRHLKFDALLQQALALGCDFIATGHYAQIVYDSAAGRYLLKRAADRAKDQSYFLSCLNQFQLSHTKFPLGDMTKEQVRRIAETQGFQTAHKKDSQDICFIPDGDYVSFMERYSGKHYPEGDFLDLQGNIVGRHSGAVSYTIGQRKGLGLAMGEPVYVCSKNMTDNTVTVGPNEALFRSELLANNWNWFPFDTLTSPMKVHAKIRYRHLEQPATVYPQENGYAKVVFDTPQRAITTGQAVVLYDCDTVVGGGTICNVL